MQNYWMFHEVLFRGHELHDHRVDRVQLESEIRIDVAVRTGLQQAQRGQEAADAFLGKKKTTLLAGQLVFGLTLVQYQVHLHQHKRLLQM